ncbi:MAG: FtsB family cell division protein [Ilumatobacteraceae bacterium]
MPSGGHSTTSIPRPRPALPQADDSRRPKRGASKRKGFGRAGTPKKGRSGTASRGAACGESSRSESTTTAASRTGSSRAGSSRTVSSRRTASADRRRDLTKAIPVERRLVEGRRKRWLLYGGGTSLFVAFAAVLFVLPVQAWFRQQDDIARKQEELAALERANAELNEEVAKLNTPEGIEEAAREEIGYVRRGEIQLTVLPLPAAPTALPGGWPFDAAAQILTLRGASAAPIAEAPATEAGGAPPPATAAP